ncbi:MAG: flagellar biosynthesis anti-sigma factor FlgM [Acetivibrio ethanolgignens]
MCLRFLRQERTYRYDKVNKIKEQLASGTYDVSAEEFADKIVNSYFNTII